MIKNYSVYLKLYYTIKRQEKLIFNFLYSNNLMNIKKYLYPAICNIVILVGIGWLVSDENVILCD